MKLFSRRPKVNLGILILRSLPDNRGMKSLIPRTYRTRRVRHTPTTKIQKFRRWGSLSLVALVVGMALMISGGVSATPTPSASAGPFDGLICNFTDMNSPPNITSWPGIAGLGADTTPYSKIYNTPNPPITAYEYFGTAGQEWSVQHYQALGAACLPFVPAAGNMIAQTIFGIDQMAAYIGLTIYSWAVTLDAFGPFLHTIDVIFVGNGPTDPNGGLVHKLFLNFMAPIVMLGALWMAWQGLVKKRSKNAIQGALWMMGAATASLIFLLHPILIASNLNKGINYVVTELISTEAAAGSGGGATTDLCYLPDSVPANVRGARMAQCEIWRAFVYTPWANGQFGSTVDTIMTKSKKSTSTSVHTVEVLPYAAQSVTIPGHAPDSNIALVYLNAHVYNHDEAMVMSTLMKASTIDAVAIQKINGPKADANTAVIATLANLQEAGANPENKLSSSTPDFTGDNWASRISIAFVDLVAMFAALIPVMILTFSLITLQLGLVFLLMLAPIFLTFGIHPGFGRKLTMSWLEMIMSNSLKRIGNAFLLGMILLLFEAITTMRGVAWLMQVVLLVAASIGFMAYKGKILKGFHINLGGDSSHGDITPFKQVGSRLGSNIAAFARDGAAYEGGRVAGGINGIWGRNKHTRQLRALGKEVKEHRDPLRKLEKNKTAAQKERREQMNEDSLMDNTSLGEMSIWQKRQEKTGRPVSRPVDPAKLKWLDDAGIPWRERVIGATKKDTTGDKPLTGAGNIPVPLNDKNVSGEKTIKELEQIRETLLAEREGLNQSYAEDEAALSKVENEINQMGPLGAEGRMNVAEELRKKMNDTRNRSNKIGRTLREMDDPSLVGRRQSLQEERKDLVQRFADSKNTLARLDHEAGQFRVDAQGNTIDGTVPRQMATQLRGEMSDMSNRALEIDTALMQIDEGTYTDQDFPKPSVRRPVTPSRQELLSQQMKDLEVERADKYDMFIGYRDKVASLGAGDPNLENYWSEMNHINDRIMEIDLAHDEIMSEVDQTSEKPSVKRPYIVEIPPVLASHYGSTESVPSTESIAVEDFEVPESILPPRRPQDTNEPRPTVLRPQYTEPRPTVLRPQYTEPRPTVRRPPASPRPEE